MTACDRTRAAMACSAFGLYYGYASNGWALGPSSYSGRVPGPSSVMYCALVDGLFELPLLSEPCCVCKLSEDPSGRPCDLLPDPPDVPTTPWPGSSPLVAVTVARNTDFDLFYPSISLPACPRPCHYRCQVRPVVTYDPWRCLCLGFALQMTYRYPFPRLPFFRRTICIAAVRIRPSGRILHKAAPWRATIPCNARSAS